MGPSKLFDSHPYVSIREQFYASRLDDIEVPEFILNWNKNLRRLSVIDFDSTFHGARDKLIKSKAIPLFIRELEKQAIFHYEEIG